MGAAPVDVLKIDFTAGSTDQKADSGAYIDLERKSPNTWPGVVFFSSGVSGAPKGVVHSRRYLQLCPEVPPDDVVLVHRPANWAGWSMILLTAIIQGRRAEIIDPSASPGIVWDRLRDSKVTILSSTVFLWEVLARHFQNVLRFLPSEEKKSYLEAVQSLRSAAALAVSYGNTELGTFATILDPNSDSGLERSIGKQASGLPVKLSEGTKGEIRIKGPTTFLGYLNNEIDFQDIFDEEGFLKTGDIAHQVRDEYVFDGRISMDFIKTPGGPVPILQLESSLNKLPSGYIAKIV
ncbi:uncharacterized protein N7484_007406 [Penicillium longicatenatum]|uniref:uncharacterized protein n=1 Tax=Penicillium longicatenatum TaxID=1561947 RepID=UPI002549A35A|nr:uncharacterized protein N7484_007406 [Penicillium longicatenatum]KAJ5639544.1 hypothetical protein N7484_007406 [Penicillium longicatenatum]